MRGRKDSAAKTANKEARRRIQKQEASKPRIKRTKKEAKLKRRKPIETQQTRLAHKKRRKMPRTHVQQGSRQANKQAN
jgi:hypothetical protein